jgi:hypothetical protein
LAGAARRVVTVLLLLALSIGGMALQTLLPETGRWVLLGLAAWPALALRSLYQHVVPVTRALEAQDLPAARRAVGMIVGRDVAALDEAGVARAAIEASPKASATAWPRRCSGWSWAVFRRLGLQGDQHRRQPDRPPRSAGAPSAGPPRG